MAPRTFSITEELAGDPDALEIKPVTSDNIQAFVWRPVLRDPPLCELWQLQEVGPRTYSIVDLMKFNEVIDMELVRECRVRRARAAQRAAAEEVR
jgi:hypothetical protein